MIFFFKKTEATENGVNKKNKASSIFLTTLSTILDAQH
jgi:hypothetical protein